MLNKQIDNDLITATKNSDTKTRDVLRLVKTAIKNSEIARGHELTDEEIVDVLAKEVKQRAESITAFTTGGRPELAEREQSEIEIIKKYLPEQLTEEQVQPIIELAIAELKATNIADMGKVMAAIGPKVNGRVDMGLVSGLVRNKLGS